MDEKELAKILNRMGNDMVTLFGVTRSMGMDYAELLKLFGAGGMLLKEPMQISDRLIVEHRSKDGGLLGLRDSGWSPNGLTNDGFASVAGLLLTDVGGTASDYVAIGTNTGTFAATQTVLLTETHREAGTGTRVTTTVTNDTAQLVRTFSGYSGTEAVAESGVFNASSGGTMLCRQTFTVLNADWTGGDTLQTTWKIQAKQGT